MNETFIKLCMLLLILRKSTDGAHILGIAPIPSYSHQQVFQPIWRELSLRGHQVVVLTANPLADPSLINLTEIDLSFSYKLWTYHIAPLITGHNTGIMDMFNLFRRLMPQLIEEQFNLPEVRKLIRNKTEHFDLIITEHLPVYFAFGKRFNCPVIGVMTVDGVSAILRSFGNPTHPVLVPDLHLGYLGKLSFFERVASVLSEQLISLVPLLFKHEINRIAQKHFGDSVPHYDELEMLPTVLFMNSDPVLNRVRPLLPMIVQIGGGIHIRPPKPLPQHLREIVDSASEGFIYFSLGTNVKSEYLDVSKIDTLLQVFVELPYTILWKCDDPALLEGKMSDNVVISKWFPQQDLLRHPNIKLFISQGGYQSLEETLYAEIPVLVMPVFGDQHFNAKLAVSKGFGKSLNIHDITKESLKSTILELITNPQYKRSAAELANLARDQPMTGLEKAVWWSEYVIRNKGAKHLRSVVLDLPTYQYYFVDIIAFYVTIAIISVYLLKLSCSACYDCLCHCFS